MKIRLIISFIFMLSRLCSIGQDSLATRVFYTHTQSCHFTGTTEEDFIIEIYIDSTIKISKYSSSYLDKYNSVLRHSFFGTYKITGDTLTIKYLKHNSEIKTREQNNAQTLSSKKTDNFLMFPPVNFIVRDNSIKAIETPFPILKITSLQIGTELHQIFKHWEFMPYETEIFGSR